MRIGKKRYLKIRLSTTQLEKTSCLRYGFRYAVETEESYHVSELSSLDEVQNVAWEIIKYDPDDDEESQGADSGYFRGELGK